ncbi:MAG: hypothetical protein GTO55_09655, partial [Armatimonadetes bacterium]|nr:hypothetical protein [Armatimonadota bacterium]NIO57217.1 hypothetical protein [Candidatus Latescibacterota bacterium]NIM24508.1 hypothetical protein [Armatimonadota bacterium]NIM68384.1 hypothetical protein [Armatimonadota bacterium]NIM76770.1 hypothetical protein [Armatimonadota bacterium]
SKDRWLISGVVVYVAVQIYALIVLIPAGMTGEFEMLWFIFLLPGLIIAALAGLLAATFGIAVRGRRFGLRWGFLHFDAAAIAFAISLIAIETFRPELSLTVFVIWLAAPVAGAMVATWLMITKLNKPAEQL